MKEKGHIRKIAGLILTSLLVIGSLGTAAALASSVGDAVPKDTVISAPIPPAPSETAAVTQETIQYSKDVYDRADGSESFVIERWYNPETQEYRSNSWEYTADHQAVNHKSTYYVGGGNEYIIIRRDENGNPVSGTVITRDDQPRVFIMLDMEYVEFSKVKDFYEGSSWTFIGTQQTADGKTLNKIMKSYQSYINDTTQANMQLIEFIDQETGLPVKQELYEDSTGEYKLFSSDVMEYSNVADDGTFFNVPDIDQTPYQVPTLDGSLGN